MHSLPVMSVLILNRLSDRLGKKKSGFPFFFPAHKKFPGLKEGISNGTYSINIFKRKLVAR
jgi:hypothetical protein